MCVCESSHPDRTTHHKMSTIACLHTFLFRSRLSSPPVLACLRTSGSCVCSLVRASPLPSLFLSHSSLSALHSGSLHAGRSTLPVALALALTQHQPQAALTAVSPSFRFLLFSSLVCSCLHVSLSRSSPSPSLNLIVHITHSHVLASLVLRKSRERESMSGALRSLMCMSVYE